jgi:hypothetical protein
MYVMNAYMVSIRNVRVNSISNGYVGNGLCVCLVLYQVLSVHSPSKGAEQEHFK